MKNTDRRKWTFLYYFEEYVIPLIMGLAGAGIGFIIVHAVGLL